MAITLTEHERLFALPPNLWDHIFVHLGVENRFVSKVVEGRNFVLWTVEGHRVVFVPDKEIEV